MILRPVDAGDVVALVDFGVAEFTRTFGHLYTAKDLQDYLEETYTVSNYLRWIDNPEYRLWVAVDGEEGGIKAYILCGVNGLPLESVDESLKQNKCGEIKRIYLHPDTFGSGLAARLMDLAIEWLRVRYGHYIYLGVYSENFRAQKFYAKYGFDKVGEYLFPVGETSDREFILKLRATSD